MLASDRSHHSSQTNAAAAAHQADPASPFGQRTSFFDPKPHHANKKNENRKRSNSAFSNSGTGSHDEPDPAAFERTKRAEKRKNAGFCDGDDAAQAQSNKRRRQHAAKRSSSTSTTSEHDTDESKARKQQAKAEFEQFIRAGKKTASDGDGEIFQVRNTSEIFGKLTEIEREHGLNRVYGSMDGEAMTIAYFASPPDFSHLTLVHGPDQTQEEAHPAGAFNASLQSLDKDADLKTPLGAIMKTLSLPPADVKLLHPGNLEQADRPKRVQATVVGARRQPGTRITGAVVPSTIAHLGHHENMLLNNDNSTWIGYYDGGHLVGDQLMPSNRPDTFVEWNLAPMEQILNQQSYLNFVERVVARGAVDDVSNKVNKTVPISVVVSVYYPDQTYKVQETALAKAGFIPNDGTIPQTGNMQNKGGTPISGQNRTITIPSRVPHRWVFHAKVNSASHSFQAKAKATSSTNIGRTAYPYFSYSDLAAGAVGIPFADLHWWQLRGAKKDNTGAITPAAKKKEIYFEAYQYYPPR
ncbi:hypothetical protein Pse7367_2091 [Thalassoporum mexicanum PCC 7367]|uniref:hypothetical protein n=1 Tax=Thalassoporum mexicanum TaxID=3457544 RepID=UPI00029F8FA9|nr:hypothetical protein [Pseudanabaena sp. PCC 7367]AFY70359.1 hypothetical protein Pse7367_2091 [Pseudanabaena sp. PCC 7367]